MKRINDSIIYDGNIIGNNFTIGYYALIRQDNTIGHNVSIGSYTEIAYKCCIGNDVKIHSKCFICEGSIIGKHSWIGPCVTMANDKYPQTNNKNKRAPVIGENCIIGAGVLIMPGVVIGNNAIVGAHSTVVKSVPKEEVWAGNPAKFIKKRCDINEYTIV